MGILSGRGGGHLFGNVYMTTIKQEAAENLGRGSGARSSWLQSTATIALMIVLQFPIGAYVIAGNGLDAEVGRGGVFWALTAIMVCYILFVERRPLSSVSLRLPNWKSLTFGSAGAAAMIAGMAL